MAKSPNSVSGAGPVKSTSNGQHTRGIHRKETREYSLASPAVTPSRFFVNSLGVLTVTGRLNCPLEGYRADPWKILVQNPIEKSGDHVGGYMISRFFYWILY